MNRGRCDKKVGTSDEEVKKYCNKYEKNEPVSSVSRSMMIVFYLCPSSSQICVMNRGRYDEKFSMSNENFDFRSHFLKQI